MVILGGGFAGVEAVKEVARIGLTNLMNVSLINKSNKFEFLPALPELLSGKVLEEDITGYLPRYAQRHGVNFLKEEVRSINLDSSILVTNKRELSFNYLIIALGAEPNFYSVSGVENVIPAYRVSDYLKIKEELRKMIQRRKPAVVIAGAGLTGVEVAGEIMDYFEENNVSGEVTLVEKMASTLPLLCLPRASALVEEFLEKRDVKFVFSKGVTEVRRGETILEDKTSIQHDLMIWTAGIKPSNIAKGLKVPKVRGWIKVDPYMRVKSFKNVYAVGDINYAEVDGRVAMEAAGEAIDQAKIAVRNIYRSMRRRELIKHEVSYSIDSPKCLISLGQNTAVLVYGRRIVVNGRIPYLIKKKLVEERYMRRFRRFNMN